MWDGDELVGGTFGVRVGGVFSADSQFTLRSGAAKVAVACLVRRVAESGGVAVDVQHDGDHARLIGAVPDARARSTWRCCASTPTPAAPCRPTRCRPADWPRETLGR